MACTFSLSQSLLAQGTEGRLWALCPPAHPSTNPAPPSQATGTKNSGPNSPVGWRPGGQIDEKWFNVSFCVRNESVCELRGLEVCAPGETFPRNPRQEQHSAPCQGGGNGSLIAPSLLGVLLEGFRDLERGCVSTRLGTDTHVSGLLATPHSQLRAAHPACPPARAYTLHWAPTTGPAAGCAGPARTHGGRWWLS